MMVETPTKEWSKEDLKELYEESWGRGIARAIELQAEILKRPVIPNEVGLLWRTFFEQERLVILKEFLDRLEAGKGTTILDIGCGLTVFADLYPPKLCPKVTAVDIAENILDYQRKKHPHIDFRVGDAQDLVLDGKWDIVHAGEVAEHLFFPRRAIDRWCKYVADGGAIIITTPTPTLKRIEGQHVRFVSQGDIRRLFYANGIDLVEAKGLVPFIPVLANLLLRSSAVERRNAVFRRYIRMSYEYPMLSSQAFYMGRKR